MGSEAQELGLKGTWNPVSFNGIWLQENSQSWVKGTCNPMDCNGIWLQGKSQSGPKGTCNPVGCNGIPLQGKSIYNSYTLLIPLTSNWPLTTVLPFCLLGHSLIFQVSFIALWAQNWAALLCIQFSGNTWAWASSFSLQTDKISVPMWLEKFFLRCSHLSVESLALPILTASDCVMCLTSVAGLLSHGKPPWGHTTDLLDQDHPQIQERVPFLLPNTTPLWSFLALRSLKDTGTLTCSYTHVFLSSIPKMFWNLDS